MAKNVIFVLGTGQITSYLQGYANLPHVNHIQIRSPVIIVIIILHVDFIVLFNKQLRKKDVCNVCIICATLDSKSAKSNIFLSLSSYYYIVRLHCM